MKLLFVADPIESFKTYKDTTYTMMREATQRGHTVAVCEPRHLRWVSGQKVQARVRQIALTGDEGRWFKQESEQDKVLAEFDAVLMRKDPPFDAEFIYATHLLEQAEREGACVINRPKALRDHPEKLAVMEFPEHVGPTLVTRSADDVKAFHAEHGDLVLKPLDGMGGMGIFRVGPDGLNLGSITETLNHHGATTFMVQKFLPEISEGDKRIIIIDGEPAPYVLARIPQGTEVRGNLAAGGKGVAQPISDADRATARAIGSVLSPRGLLLIGLDIIGTKVTEINVTSPTGFREIMDQTGCDVPALYIDAVEKRMASHPRA